jgi:hypothetical protein
MIKRGFLSPGAFLLRPPRVGDWKDKGGGDIQTIDFRETQ